MSHDRAVPSYVLRTAGPADTEALLAFWRTSAEPTNRSDTALGIGLLLARDPEAVLLAEDGDAIVGSVIAGWDGWRCHLYRLAVHPDRRREGIGSALLAAAELRFARLGGVRSDAMVLDDNDLGRKAWTAAGYHPQEEWTRWVKQLTRTPPPSA
jgi:ribosomal protein S18 acetylase RimI-like enzyme